MRTEMERMLPWISIVTTWRCCSKKRGKGKEKRRKGKRKGEGKGLTGILSRAEELEVVNVEFGEAQLSEFL